MYAFQLKQHHSLVRDFLLLVFQQLYYSVIESLFKKPFAQQLIPQTQHFSIEDYLLRVLYMMETYILHFSH